MTENNDFDEVNQESSDASQPSCSSTPTGDDCCSPGDGKTWKTVVFLIVILLAGAVAAHSLMAKGGKGATCPVGSSCAVGSSCGAASPANASPSCGACSTGSDACCAAGSGDASTTAADSVAVPSE